MHDVKDRKATLRTRLKQVRGELDAGQRYRFDSSIRERLLALPQVRSAAVIFMFISYGSEVDTHQCLQELQQAGKRIAVPRIMDQETMIAVPFDSWASLQPEQLGILAPPGREPLPHIPRRSAAPMSRTERAWPIARMGVRCYAGKNSLPGPLY